MKVLTLQEIAGDVLIRGLGKLTPRIKDSYEYYYENCGGREYTEEVNQCYVDHGYKEPYRDCNKYNKLPKSIKLIIRDQLDDYRGMFDFIKTKNNPFDVFYSYVIGGYVKNASLVLKYFPELLTQKPRYRLRNGSDLPLIRSVISGNYDMSKLLLDHGADVNAKDGLFRTSIVYAVEYKMDYMLRLLLEYGADVNTINYMTGKTLLHICIEKHYYRLSKILLEFGANTTMKTNDGYTPLLTATYIGDFNAVKLLLEYDTRVIDIDMCKDVAYFHGYTDICELLINLN